MSLEVINKCLPNLKHMSLTSTASAIVMTAARLASSGVGRSHSKASESNSLKSGVPASRVAKGFSACLHHQQQALPRSYSPPSPSPFPHVLLKDHEMWVIQTQPGFEHGHP